MLNRLFIYLLNKKCSTYNGTIEVQRLIQEKIDKDLSEQTIPGLVWEGFDCWARGMGLKNRISYEVFSHWLSYGKDIYFKKEDTNV